MQSLTLPSASSAPASLNVTKGRCGATILWKRGVLYFGISSVGCLVDLLTKHFIFQWLGVSSRDNIWWLWENYFGIQTTLNRGALFGMGEGGGKVFATLSILAAIGIVLWLFVFGAAKSRWLTVALGIITAGILGNLYDRLGLWTTPRVPEEFQCAVRDWILFRAGYEEWSWPNFNIADSLLVSGAAMLLWQAYWEKDGPGPKGP